MTTTTSPIVGLLWTLARIVANAPSQADLGYPYKVKAQSLTVTRANGTVEEHVASATKGEVTQALRAEHRAVMLSALVQSILAARAEWTEANPEPTGKGATPEKIEAHVKAKAEAFAKIDADTRTAFYTSGSVTFQPSARAARTATLDDSDDIAAMIAAANEA